MRLAIRPTVAVVDPFEGSRGAHHGDSEALFNLGRMYDLGDGVPQDHAEAAKWFRKAADQGLAEAHFNPAACTRAEAAFGKTTSEPSPGAIRRRRKVCKARVGPHASSRRE